MTILKVKNWVSKAQFEPLPLFAEKYILDVKRLCDNRIVKSGYFYNFINPDNKLYQSASFMIYKFNLDLIHVKYEITFTKNGGYNVDSISGECEINDIIFNSDNTGVLKL